MYADATGSEDVDPADPDETRRQILAKWDAMVGEGSEPPSLVVSDDQLMAGVDRFYSTAEAAEFFGRSNQWMYYCMRNGRFMYPPVWHVRVANPQQPEPTPSSKDPEPWRRHAWHRYTKHPYEEMHGRFTAVDEPDLTLSTLGDAEHDMEWTNENRTLIYRYFAEPIEPIRIGLSNRRRFTLPIIREIALSCYRLGNFKESELKAVLARIFVAEFGKGALTTDTG